MKSETRGGKLNECEGGGSDVFHVLIVDNAACAYVKQIFFLKKKTDPGIKRREKEKTKKKGRENKTRCKAATFYFRKTCVCLASLPQ